jgi:succinyl-diaminopimelate desuccinylase
LPPGGPPARGGPSGSADRPGVVAVEISQLEELLDGSATYEVVDFAPSGPVNLENPLLQELIETGLEVRPKQAWTDVARFSERGVAAANFGPGLPSQAHKENEYAELSLLEECYTHLASFFA